jgi:hypothetical protein
MDDPMKVQKACQSPNAMAKPLFLTSTDPMDLNLNLFIFKSFFLRKLGF